MSYKIIIAVITVILAFVAYTPYIRDIIKGKTTPHVFSWFVWTLTAGVSAALQIHSGGGFGAWTTLTAALLHFVVFIFSFRKGSKDITVRDVVFLVLALASVFLWLIAQQPFLSALLVLLAEFFAFAPTIRKAWLRPDSETLFTWQINSTRQVLSLFALSQFNFLTLFYPVAWSIANILFSVMLVFRRKSINDTNNLRRI